jgi:hypothetical protein
MFPIEEWLQGPWAGVFGDGNAAGDVPTGTWYRQWCVRAYEAWLDRLRHTPAVAEPQSPVVVTRGANG